MPASSVPTSAIPSVPTALQRCDKPIDEATTMAIKIEDCVKQLATDHAAMTADAVKPNNTVPRGLPDTRFAQIPEDVSAPAAKELLNLATPTALRTVLSDYFAYLAFASNSPEPCKRLAPVDFEGPCRENFASLNEMRALMGEPWELVKSCRASENKGSPSTCCTILAKLKDRSNPCAAMVPSCFREMAVCKSFWGRADGDAKLCAGIPVRTDEGCKTDGCDKERAQAVARCEGDALYGRAFKAKDISVCGTAQRCRVLMGKGNDVAAEIAATKLQNPGGAWFTRSGWKAPPPPPEAPVGTATVPRKPQLDYKGFVCVEPLQSADNRKVAANMITVAKTCLTDIEAAVGIPSKAMTEGIDEREEKLARLTVRLELALAAGTPPVKKPAPAKPARTR